MKKILILLLALLLTVTMISCDVIWDVIMPPDPDIDTEEGDDGDKGQNKDPDNEQNKDPDNEQNNEQNKDPDNEQNNEQNKDPDNEQGNEQDKDPDNEQDKDQNEDDKGGEDEVIIGAVEVLGGNEAINLYFATVEGYTYEVYYRLFDGSDFDYVKLDRELMLTESEGFRCYILGITAGTYKVKIEAHSIDKDESFEIVLTNIEVSGVDRSGYAHFGAVDGVGAYNNDGTLKQGTRIIYVTNENKNTVTCEINGQVYTGLVNILQAQYKSNVPMLIRVIGRISTNQWNYKNVEPRLSDGSNATDDFFENTFSTEYGENLANLIVKIKGNGGGAKTYNYKTTPEGLTDVRLTNSGSKTTTYKGTDFPALKGKSTFDDDSYYNMLEVKGSSNITIEGIGEGAEFFQFGIGFEECSSIEIKNITFTDYPEDALNFLGGDRVDLANYSRFWVHNCTFNMGKNNWDVSGERDKYNGDGSIDFNNVSNVTLAYNFFNQTHKTMLFGSGDSEACMNMTMHHNYFYKTSSRLPLGRNVNIHSYNNYFDQCKNCTDIRKNSYVFSEGNYYASTSKPFILSSSYVKSFGDIFDKSSSSGIYKVTDRTKTISASCKPNGSTNLANFDTNADIFYYDTVNKCSDVSVMVEAKDVPEFVTKHAGAGKFESLNIK